MDWRASVTRETTALMDTRKKDIRSQTQNEAHPHLGSGSGVLATTSYAGHNGKTTR